MVIHGSSSILAITLSLDQHSACVLNVFRTLGVTELDQSTPAGKTAQVADLVALARSEGPSPSKCPTLTAGLGQGVMTG